MGRSSLGVLVKTESLCHRSMKLLHILVLVLVAVIFVVAEPEPEPHRRGGFGGGGRRYGGGHGHGGFGGFGRRRYGGGFGGGYGGRRWKRSADPAPAPEAAAHALSVSRRVVGVLRPSHIYV